MTDVSIAIGHLDPVGGNFCHAIAAAYQSYPPPFIMFSGFWMKTPPC